MLRDSLINVSMFVLRSLRRRSSVKRTSRNTSVVWKKFAKHVKRECVKDAVRTRGIAVVTKVGTGDESLFHVIVDITDVKVAQNLSSTPTAPPFYYFSVLNAREAFGASGKIFSFSKFSPRLFIDTFSETIFLLWSAARLEEAPRQLWLID